MTAPNTRLTILVADTEGSVSVNGQLQGPSGREVTLTATPKPGYQFSFWSVDVETGNVEFSVVAGTGTINGKRQPFVESIPFGTVYEVTCLADQGFVFEKAEKYNLAGNSLGLIIPATDQELFTFSFVADGEVAEVRVWFKEIQSEEGGGGGSSYCTSDNDCPSYKFCQFTNESGEPLNPNPNLGICVKRSLT